MLSVVLFAKLLPSLSIRERLVTAIAPPFRAAEFPVKSQSIATSLQAGTCTRCAKEKPLYALCRPPAATRTRSESMKSNSFVFQTSSSGYVVWVTAIPSSTLRRIAFEVRSLSLRVIRTNSHRILVVTSSMVWSTVWHGTFPTRPPRTSPPK